MRSDHRCGWRFPCLSITCCAGCIRSRRNWRPARFRLACRMPCFRSASSRVTVQAAEGRSMIMTCRKIPGCFLTHSGLGCISCAREQKRYLTVNLLDGAESDITLPASLASFAPTGGDTRVYHRDCRDPIVALLARECASGSHGGMVCLVPGFLRNKRAAAIFSVFYCHTGAPPSFGIGCDVRLDACPLLRRSSSRVCAWWCSSWWWAAIRLSLCRPMNVPMWCFC